jgi:hypothetical protein
MRERDAQNVHHALTFEAAAKQAEPAPGEGKISRKRGAYFMHGALRARFSLILAEVVSSDALEGHRPPEKLAAQDRCSLRLAGGQKSYCGRTIVDFGMAGQIGG